MDEQIRLPAEWEPQSGVLLTWPHAFSDWRPILDRVEPVYVSLAEQITKYQRAVILCWDDSHRLHIQSLLESAGAANDSIRYCPVQTNDTWIRDYGPVAVLRNGVPELLDFTFNSWGGKYPHDKDNLANKRLREQGLFRDAPMRSVDLVLEGGSIETDGQGTLLTTTQCLLSPRRNPQLDKAQIARRLSRLLGVERVVWLNSGAVAGDDTDSHIDILARFCSTDTLVYTSCNDPQDENFAPLKQMEDELRALRTTAGQPYTLIPLPWPGARFDTLGNRLPATYANFLIINGAVLAPVYGDPMDERSLRILEACFPRRTVVPIDCGPLIHQGGSLHCATMQLPQGVIV